jgi:hypothetical protein
MNREQINEYKSRFRIVDDDAKPMGGSFGQYTRLAVVVLRPERGAERTFTLFAESTKLVQAIGKAVGDPEWITEGFTQKWMYIEEVLFRPSDTARESIDNALQRIEDTDLWRALDEYLRESGVMDRFAKSIKANSYGLPTEEQPGVGLAPGAVPRQGVRHEHVS